MSPAPHTWSEGARLRLVPAVMRQYSNVEPPVHLFAAKRVDKLPFRRARPMRGDDREHRINHEIGRGAQEIELFAGLAGAQPLERQMRFDERDPWKLASHEFGRIGGQKGALDADPFQLPSELCEMIGGKLRGIETRPRRMEGRGPELPSSFS